MKSYQNFSEDIEQRRQVMKQKSREQLQKFKSRTVGAQQERQADAADRENMKKEIKKGIFPVKPLKPTGAGDAFMGSLIGSILKTNDLEKSIEIGSAAAAIVVTKVGCAPAMPNLNEILEFMKYNKINEGE